ncbi:MAG: NAD(P)H-hydrate dehydratase [Clostridia bacterium]|jgi:NAD(P)H-hydrate epimerase
MTFMKIVEYSQNDISDFFQPRKAESNKSDFGKFLVIAGSAGMTGALKLCVDSCYRSGAGLVYYTALRNSMLLYDLLTTEGITVPLEDVLSLIDNKDCICIGCGLDNNKENMILLNSVLENSKCRIVADATALKMLSGKKDILKKHGYKMTILPHPGEMSCLNGIPISDIQKNRIGTAYSFYEEYGCITVLKGHNTVVAGNGSVYVNMTGNPGMATAGSGDVLAGITTAYTVMSGDMFYNACMAVHIHGLAGDLAVKDLGMISMIASDIIRYLPKAHKEVAGGKA